MTCIQELRKCTEMKTNVHMMNTWLQNHPQHIERMDVGVSKEIIFILVVIFSRHKKGTLPLRGEFRMGRISSVGTQESAGPKRITQTPKNTNHLNWTFSFPLLNFISFVESNLLFPFRCWKGKCCFDNIRLGPEGT